MPANDDPRFSALSDPHHVPVVFVNEVSNYGFLNGVVNVTFSTAQFTPVTSANDMRQVEIAQDLVITSRLRMDLKCAMDLHAALGALIESNTKGITQSVAAADASAKPN